jgi:DNA polymerase sigma
MVVSFLQRHPKVAAGHILPDQNLGAMLIEILELYGTRFNYDRVGIAVDRGGYYFDKLELQSLNQKLWKQIWIRDPNDESNNIAKASHQVDNIIKVFSDAFREITTRCYVVHGSIRSGENASGGLKSGSILDAILYSQNSLSSRTALPISKPGQNPSTSNLSRRGRRLKDRSNKDGIKMNGEVASTAADMSNRRGVERDHVLTEATVGVGGSKDTPILLDDSTELSPSFVISEINLTAKKKGTGGKKSDAGKPRVVVKLQPKTSV